MPNADNARAVPAVAAAPANPTVLTTGVHYAHEDTDEYARKLLREIQVAQERLQSLVDMHDPTVMVTVTTALPMDDLLRVKCEAKAEEMFHAPVYLIERVDPSIMGGIIIEAPGRRYDASVRTQLSAVRKGLVAKSDEGGA